MSEPVALEAAFRRIAATRMAGMALGNPALAVEAVGFRDWHGHRLGVLITPWAMNLVLLAGGGVLAPLAPGQQVRRHFPSGDYEFMGGHEPECGAFQFCPLLSPPAQFTDQAQARAVAGALMELLLGGLPMTRRALFTPPPTDPHPERPCTR